MIKGKCKGSKNSKSAQVIQVKIFGEIFDGDQDSF